MVLFAGNSSFCKTIRKKFFSRKCCTSQQSNKFYYQMLEMPIGEEESMVRLRNESELTANAHGILFSNRYDSDIKHSYHQNCGQNALADKRKFSAEENMFAMNKRNRLHSQKSKYAKFHYQSNFKIHSVKHF